MPDPFPHPDEAHNSGDDTRSDLPAGPAPTTGDDLDDANEPFDAAQWAMHGLLRVYFEAQDSDRNERADRILARLGIRPTGVAAHVPARPFPLRQPFRRLAHSRAFRRWVTRGVGLAAACFALILVSLLFHRTPTAMAAPLADAATAGAMWFRLVGVGAMSRENPDGGEFFRFVLDRDSPEARAQEKRLVDLERKVREGTDRYERNPLDDVGISDFCGKWQSYYVLLRDLGRRDDAVREAKAAVDFAKNKSQHGQPFAYLDVFLDGLGNVHAAFGEYEDARRTYEESISVRRRRSSPDWLKDRHYGEPGYEGHMAWGIAPMYLRLMCLAIAQDDLAGARENLGLAERAMTQRITTICETNGLAVPPNATLWEAWRLLEQVRNDEFRRPTRDDYSDEKQVGRQLYQPGPTLPAWVRTTIYHEALLLRAEGDYAAAQAALDRAATIADYPNSCEFRLPFLENLEATRLAIIRGDYATALLRVQDAERALRDPAAHPGPAAPEVNRLPPAQLRTAELHALKGIALRGQDPKSAEAKQLINQAMTVVRKLADSRRPDQREAFLKQFESWRLVAGVPGQAQGSSRP